MSKDAMKDAYISPKGQPLVTEMDSLRRVLSRQADEIERIKGEAGVLRELLRDALIVIEIVDQDDSDEGTMLTALKSKMKDAIIGLRAS
jgi:hypothetical protein